jgi:hypothetical protein
MIYAMARYHFFGKKNRVQRTADGLGGELPVDAEVKMWQYPRKSRGITY